MEKMGGGSRQVQGCKGLVCPPSHLLATLLLSHVPCFSPVSPAPKAIRCSVPLPCIACFSPPSQGCLCLLNFGLVFVPLAPQCRAPCHLLTGSLLKSLQGDLGGSFLSHVFCVFPNLRKSCDILSFPLVGGRYSRRESSAAFLLLPPQMASPVLSAEQNPPSQLINSCEIINGS